MNTLAIPAQGLPLCFYMREDGETVALVLQEMIYRTCRGSYTVPAGFASDGCSLPPFLWRLFGHPFSMHYLREAILHDWLYWIQPCSRRIADIEFRELLELSVVLRRVSIRTQILLETPDISDEDMAKEYKRREDKANIISNTRIRSLYTGLWMFGWAAWNNNKKRKLKGESKIMDISEIAGVVYG